MRQSIRKKQAGTGILLRVGDGGSPEQFHTIGELTALGKPGLEERIKEFGRRVQAGQQVTTADFWFLAGIPVLERLAKLRDDSKNALAWLQAPERKGSTEYHAAINREIVGALWCSEVSSGTRQPTSERAN